MEPIQNPQPQEQTTKNTSSKPKANKKKILIGIAAAVVLIGAGVAAYMFFKKDEPKPTATQTSTTKTTDTKVQVGEYLEIPELEVRLKLPAEIKDAYYELTTETSKGREWANISTKTLKDLDSGCSAAKDSISPGYVGYFTDPSEPYGVGENSTISTYYPDNFKIGDNYVFYTTYNQAPCYGDGVYGTTKGNEIDSIFKLFKRARLEGINSPKTDSATSKDVDEINKTLTELCPSPNKFDAVTLELLNYEGAEDKDRTYYNGFVKVGLSCTGPGEEGGMGYYVVLKRQPDSSWTKILAGQDIAECSELTTLKIPSQIYRTCRSGEDFISNPN